MLGAVHLGQPSVVWLSACRRVGLGVPGRHNSFAGIAQLAERLPCKEDVAGSNPCYRLQCLLLVYQDSGFRRLALAAFYSKVEMAQTSITLRITMAWWWKPYVYGLATMAAITGREPNWERVNVWVKRAMKVRWTR